MDIERGVYWGFVGRADKYSDSAPLYFLGVFL